MKSPYQESDAYDYHCIPFKKILTFNPSEPLRIVLSQPNAQWTKFELQNIAIYPNAYNLMRESISQSKRILGRELVPMDGISHALPTSTNGVTSMHELIEYDVKVLRNVLNMNQHMEANVHVDEGDEDEEE